MPPGYFPSCVPADPGMFDFYGKGGFTNFGDVPTWKRAPPHNIRRRTRQAANCNNCHGNRGLFLADADLPKAVTRTRKLAIDTSKVRTGVAGG